MKLLFALLVIGATMSCQGPNNAASTRTSTAPLSNDPTETMPSTASDEDNNRVRPTTGTAPTNEQLPDGNGSPAQSDSTARR